MLRRLIDWLKFSDANGPNVESTSARALIYLDDKLIPEGELNMNIDPENGSLWTLNGIVIEQAGPLVFSSDGSTVIARFRRV